MAISREDFMKLGAGDVVIWNKSGNNPLFRTVIEGPRDHPERRNWGVSFPIRRRSWTNRSHTSYGWNDCKDIITPTGKRHNAIFTEEELDRILALRLKPKWDLLDMIGQNVRTGCQCGKRAAVLAQRALQAFKFANIK